MSTYSAVPFLVSLIVLAPSGFALAQGSQHALQFFGTGTGQQDRVRIPIDDNTPGPDASAPCDVGDGGFTVEFWLRGTLADNSAASLGGDVETSDFSWINGNIVVDRDIWGASEADWGISLRGGFVTFGTGRGDPPGQDADNTIEGDVGVLDGTWHHVAVTRDATIGIKRIYVDGVLDFASSAGASQDDISYPNGGDPAPNTPWGPYIVLAAEKHDAGSSFPSFAGFLDEVRVWNVARSAAQIASDRALILPAGTPGLVGDYRFEEGSGTSLADSSSAGSPTGELIAGVPGNGQWVSYASDPSNTAPVAPAAMGVPTNSVWGLLAMMLTMIVAGLIMIRGRSTGTLWANRVR